MTKLKKQWVAQERRILNALEIIATSSIRQTELFEEQQKMIKTIISVFEKVVTLRANDNKEIFLKDNKDCFYPENVNKIMQDTKYKFKTENDIPPNFKSYYNSRYGYTSEYAQGVHIKLEGCDTLFHLSTLIPV